MAWDKQWKQFISKTQTQCVHPGVPTSTLAQPLWHPRKRPSRIRKSSGCYHSHANTHARTHTHTHTCRPSSIIWCPPPPPHTHTHTHTATVHSLQEARDKLAKWDSFSTLPQCWGAAGCGNPSLHGRTAGEQWAAGHILCTAILLWSSWQWDSFSALPLYWGALGGVTPSALCHTAAFELIGSSALWTAVLDSYVKHVSLPQATSTLSVCLPDLSLWSPPHTTFTILVAMHTFGWTVHTKICLLCTELCNRSC